MKCKAGEWLGIIREVKHEVSESTKAKEGLALLIRNERGDCVQACKELSSKLMSVEMKVDYDRWVLVSGHALGSKKKGMHFGKS